MCGAPDGSTSWTLQIFAMSYNTRGPCCYVAQVRINALSDEVRPDNLEHAKAKRRKANSNEHTIEFGPFLRHRIELQQGLNIEAQHCLSWSIHRACHLSKNHQLCCHRKVRFKCCMHSYWLRVDSFYMCHCLVHVLVHRTSESGGECSALDVYIGSAPVKVFDKLCPRRGVCKNQQRNRFQSAVPFSQTIFPVSILLERFWCPKG